MANHKATRTNEQ